MYHGAFPAFLFQSVCSSFGHAFSSGFSPVFVCSFCAGCGDSENRNARYTTSEKKEPPRPEVQAIELKPDAGSSREEEPEEGMASVGTRKFKIFSAYAGEDINQLLGVSGRTLVLSFVAPQWCPHSKEMVASLKKVAESAQGQLQVVYVDADAFPQLANSNRFHIEKVPMTFVYSEGMLLYSFTGNESPARIQEHLTAAKTQN